MNRLFSLLIIGFFALNLSAQITTTPEIPTAAKAVTITFDSSKESRLGYFTGDLYAHTGLITDKSTSNSDWKYVIESWGNNTTQPKLTNKGDGVYELEISPDILTFYSVDTGDDVLKMAFVFRNTDGTEQTENLYVDVYKEGLHVAITDPLNNAIIPQGDSVSISASSTLAADLKLYLNATELASENGTTISTDYVFESIGENWIIAEATADSTVRDSVFVEVLDYKQTKPQAYKKGINYTSNTSAALVLWAPLKTYVYVIGDFNNWQISDDYLMKKDGDYFWLDIPNLEAGKEYAFQYLIDGNLKIADPYTEKILDPWNDKYITPETYPNLIPYPENKTDGIVSVLQTAQEKYSWEQPNFQVPEKTKMVIYELLIRDFTNEHSYAAVTNKLDYLKNLNVNVLELMPVNEFEGNNSWGYNPSFYFAPDKYYGPKNELKKLIDECHKRGIAVVIDMVLNHSYNQSPFAQMYWNSSLNQPAENNPWYNETSPNTAYSWGNDFNHEADATKELVDSINSFWLNEYQVDGFRFDFTKGFTNTSGDGWAYDQSRINILKRMADEIWNRKPDALVILEHLTANTEEKVLSDANLMLWGNMNHDYTEAAMGYASNLSWGIYTNRGWTNPNLVSYMESHDEERTIYKCLNYGNSNGDYNTKDLSTALNRVKLNALFYIPLPGPKMIWQFGELGYDYSINYCEDGSINDDCRTSPKPVRWEYAEDADRTDVFHVMANLNELKQNYEEFSPDNTEYSLSGMTKWYKLSHENNHVIGLGNFDVKQSNLEIDFPTTGTYYEFFSGDSIEITNTNQSFSLAAGEYRLYSNRKFNNPDIPTGTTYINGKKSDVKLYPNPANSVVTISSSEIIQKLEIYSISGELLIRQIPEGFTTKISIDNLSPGIYLTKIYQENNSFSKKLIVK